MPTEPRPGASDAQHRTVESQLGTTSQRYTAGRRALVDALAALDQPATVHEVLDRLDATSDPGARRSASQSSAYRNLAVLERAGVVHRIVTGDDFARFELGPDLTRHHHHLVCPGCGAVVDFELPTRFEEDLDAALARAARAHGFTPEDHRLDVIGTCADCTSGS